MQTADVPSEPKADPFKIVRSYHQRTKHRFEQYAAGPDTLDWDAQPAPFRHFSNAPEITLPAFAEAEQNQALHQALKRPFHQHTTAITPLNFDLTTLGALLHLSFGITAWKSYGPDRWAVRANPSSGNLHPIEAYIIVSGFAEIADGVYHYRVEDHVLERRAAIAPTTTPCLQIGLSTIMWREAWKYGERAFRYCQLDTGHAIAGLSYAANVLGWRLDENKQLSSNAIAGLLGVDRASDFPYKRIQVTELEEAEAIFTVQLGGLQSSNENGIHVSIWHGTASTVDAHPMYQWPVIDQVAAATRYPSRRTLPTVNLPTPTISSQATLPTMAEVILGRRSAQRFDAGYTMPKQTFTNILTALLPQASSPWTALTCSSLVNLIFFIHRVEGFTPGLYLFVREPRLAQQLDQSLHDEFIRQPVEGLPTHLNLQLLTPAPTGELHRTSRSLHCHQDIAANACFAVGMLAEYDAAMSYDASSYRDMHREAGLIGQVLYLQAEAHGLRGTGIGCFFDEPIHQLLGLRDETFQTIYHFTVGLPIEDTRISTTFTHLATSHLTTQKRNQ